MKLSNLLQEISVKMPIIPPVQPASPAGKLADKKHQLASNKMKKKIKDKEGDKELSFAEILQKAIKKDTIEELEDEDFSL